MFQRQHGDAKLGLVHLNVLCKKGVGIPGIPIEWQFQWGVDAQVKRPLNRDDTKIIHGLELELRLCSEKPTYTCAEIKVSRYP